MTKCQLLLIGESLNPIVPSTPSTKLIVVDAVSKAKASQTEAEALKRQVDGVTGVEERGVARQISPTWRSGSVQEHLQMQGSLT